MIALFENYDISTVLHELAHFWLDELRDAQKFQFCPEWSKNLWNGLEEAYEFDGKTVKIFRWVEIQESFAVEFEKYCKDGKAPVKSLQPIFDKFCEWLSNIYEHVLEIAESYKIRAASRRAFDVLYANKNVKFL